MTNFTPDVEDILEKIRLNSTTLYEYNRKRFLVYTEQMKYYRIPVLVLSSVASVWSISGTTFLEQEHVSLVNMLLGLSAGLITSLELFSKLDQKMKSAEDNGHRYYALSADIYKTLLLDDANRNKDAMEYLNEVFSEYIKLNENSFLLDRKIKDQLMILPDKKMLLNCDGYSSSSFEGDNV
tara:strand:- start:260 stop:802 length:543 start_codon:yes stop_codon:yes gene_type:complete